MSHRRRPPFTKRLLLGAALAVFAAVLPLGLAVAQAPAQVSLLNVPFRGVTVPSGSFDLVQSVVDFDPGAKSPTITSTTAYYLSVMNGELTIDLAGKPETVAVGKGVSAPAGTKVTIGNASTVTKARLFVSTLVGVGAVDSIHQLSSAGLKPFGIARRTIRNAPPVVDVIQVATQYDPGWKTGNHTMNELHLFLMLTGTTDFGYLAGGFERGSPGQQMVMDEGRAGWMANTTQASSSFVLTWLGTPGKPLTSAAAAPARPSTAPAPPNTGNGLAQNGGSPSGALAPVALALAGVAALGGLALRRHKKTR